MTMMVLGTRGTPPLSPEQRAVIDAHNAACLREDEKMDWTTIKPLLDAKLDPKHVVKPSGSFGPKGDYIPGWHAIAEANRIFGHGGWSYTIDLRQDDLREGKTSKGDPQWQAAYTCVCTVTVGDVVRQDVGFGSGFAKGIGDAIEGATKESATDALKRCLRTFGHPFGLALYDKSRENVGVDAPPFVPEAARDRVYAKLDACVTPAAVTALYEAEAETVDAIKAANAELGASVVAAFKRAKKRLSDPPPDFNGPDGAMPGAFVG